MVDWAEDSGATQDEKDARARLCEGLLGMHTSTWEMECSGPSSSSRMIVG